MLHHPVEGREAVVPLAGDLDLIRRDGRAVHIQPVAREPGLDVLRASIRFTPAAAATVRVLMYRPRKALKITSAQQSAPAPTFFKLVLFSVTTNMPFPPTRFVLKRIYGAGRQNMFGTTKEPPPE